MQNEHARQTGTGTYHDALRDTFALLGGDARAQAIANAVVDLHQAAIELALATATQLTSQCAPRFLPEQAEDIYEKTAILKAIATCINSLNADIPKANMLLREMGLGLDFDNEDEIPIASFDIISNVTGLSMMQSQQAPPDQLTDYIEDGEQAFICPDCGSTWTEPVENPTSQPIEKHCGKDNCPF